MSRRVGDAFVAALHRVAARLPLDPPYGAYALGRRFGLEGFARRHGVETVPDTAAEHAARARRFYEDVILEASREISDALAQAAVPHVFVRGIALLHGPYEPGDREIADIDLHAHPEQASQAVRALRTVGYEPLADGEQSGPPTMRPGLVLRRGADATMEQVSVDLHWGLERVDRLLPEPVEGPAPALWEATPGAGGLPVPSLEHHLALIAHHLVHHDLLHVRGLLDFALLTDRLGGSGGEALDASARTLGVHRFVRVLHATVVRDLGAMPLPGVAAPPRDRRSRRLERLLEVDRWLRLAATAGPEEYGSVTRRRVARRIVLVDGAMAWAGMGWRALWPPVAFLRWRWPHARSGRARLVHLGRAAAKAWRR